MKKLMIVLLAGLLLSSCGTMKMTITDVRDNRSREYKLEEFRMSQDSIIATTKRGLPLRIPLGYFPQYEYQIFNGKKHFATIDAELHRKDIVAVVE